MTAEDEVGNEVTGDFSSQFLCDENIGTVSVNEDLDREKVETFTLEMSVSDNNAENKEQTVTGMCSL